MPAIKNILVPIDFSPCALDALRFAANLAQQYDADLDIAYVYEPTQVAITDASGAGTSAQMEQFFSELQRMLDQARGIAMDAGATHITTVLTQGVVSDAIIDQARTTKANLIVMGTHGRRGLAHFVMGSVAEKVVRSAPCPVLTVRQQAANQ